MGRRFPPGARLGCRLMLEPVVRSHVDRSSIQAAARKRASERAGASRRPLRCVATGRVRVHRGKHHGNLEIASRRRDFIQQDVGTHEIMLACEHRSAGVKMASGTALRSCFAPLVPHVQRPFMRSCFGKFTSRRSSGYRCHGRRRTVHRPNTPICSARMLAYSPRRLPCGPHLERELRARAVVLPARHAGVAPVCACSRHELVDSLRG